MRLHGTMRVNEKGHLEVGGCDAVDLARTFGTPLYVIDEKGFRDNCRAYKEAFAPVDSDVAYAGKTLLTTAICRIIAEEGLSLDVVSGGELYTAKQAGFPMSRVYFHGNNKSPQEIRMGIEAGVHRFVVDSFTEIGLLNGLAAEAGKTVDVLLRLTPGVEAHTHEYIKTGQIDSKFGLVIANGQAMEAARQILNASSLRLRGFHCHIGSQIFELQAFADAARIMLAFAGEVCRQTGYVLEELNLGGGLGIYYAEGDEPPGVADLARTIIEAAGQAVRDHDLPLPRLIVEPGRSIAGTPGLTLYTVGVIKEIPGVRTYVSVDGGMVDNPRPALYQARYEAYPANKMTRETRMTVSVAGKCCESGDMLIWNLEVPEIQPGDILAVTCTGAYNYSMASNYNRLPRPAMVLVRDGTAELIVRRESLSDLVRNDVVPARLRAGID
ncbi:diaminopimelate decarboxylase [Desulforudis sp. 1088]|uniref:diaminopimelate decarboxylase n=2 Tax=Candidatus Desulforudis TaxID=471826 RepID=UPI003CE5378C